MKAEEYLVILYCCMYQSCFKEYQNKYNLMRHININHLKKKKGNCHICGKEFIDTDNLKEHQNIHLDIKPHSCEICKKSFRNKCMLTRHLREHKFTQDIEI